MEPVLPRRTMFFMRRAGARGEGRCGSAVTIGVTDEVGEEFQAIGLAFFGMELGGENVVAPDRGGKGSSVVGAGDDDLRVVGSRMEAVDEVEVGTGGDAFEQGAVGSDDVDLIPADLGDLEVGLGRGGLESDDGPLEDAEAEGAGIEFLTPFEQGLVADADAEEGSPGDDPVADGFGQFAALQGMDAVVEGPDTGEDEAMGGIEAVG